MDRCGFGKQPTGTQPTGTQMTGTQPTSTQTTSTPPTGMSKEDWEKLDRRARSTIRLLPGRFGVVECLERIYSQGTMG
jgi:hypothetical protein